MKELLQKTEKIGKILLWISAILIGLPILLVLVWFILDTFLSYRFPRPHIEYQDGHRWTAQEVDLFFDCSSEYYQYENGFVPMIGRLRTEEGEIELWVSLPGSSLGNILEFYKVYPDNVLFCNEYFRYDAYSTNEEVFAFSRLYNTMGVSLPKRLTFTCEEITPEELYRPAWLGEKEEEPDG